MGLKAKNTCKKNSNLSKTCVLLVSTGFLVRDYSYLMVQRSLKLSNNYTNFLLFSEADYHCYLIQHSALI